MKNDLFLMTARSAVFVLFPRIYGSYLGEKELKKLSLYEKAFTFLIIFNFLIVDISLQFLFNSFSS